ncbi:MAG: uroporphyrinogen-III synthase [Conexivisphaerales archaeon]
MTHKPSIIITRSEEGNKILARQLREAGYSPIALNLTVFKPPKSWKPIDPYIKNVAFYDWLVFTSTTSVTYFVKRCRFLGIRLSRNILPKIASVGPGTMRCLQRYKLTVDFVPSSFTTSSLATELPTEYGKKVLAFRSYLGSPLLASVLKDRGFFVDEVHIYRTETRKVHATRRVLLAEATLFASPSAVGALLSSLTQPVLNELKKRPALCIGPVTARAAKDAGFQHVYEPAEQTFGSLLELVKVIV